MGVRSRFFYYIELCLLLNSFLLTMNELSSPIATWNQKLKSKKVIKIQNVLTLRRTLKSVLPVSHIYEQFKTTKASHRQKITPPHPLPSNENFKGMPSLLNKPWWNTFVQGRSMVGFQEANLNFIWLFNVFKATISARVALTSYIFDLKIPVSSKPTYFYWIINWSLAEYISPTE